MRTVERLTDTGWKAVVGLAVALLCAAAVGCTRDVWPNPPPVDPDVLAAEHEEWREGRRSNLANPNAGVLSWDGLFELADGANTFGSDPASAIVLPEEDAPPLAGILHLNDGAVRLVPEAGSGLSLRDLVSGAVGEAITEPMLLPDDRSEGTIRLALGSLGMRVHANGDGRLCAVGTGRPRLESFAFPIFRSQRVAGGAA